MISYMYEYLISNKQSFWRKEKKGRGKNKIELDEGEMVSFESQYAKSFIFQQRELTFGFKLLFGFFSKLGNLFNTILLIMSMSNEFDDSTQSKSIHLYPIIVYFVLFAGKEIYKEIQTRKQHNNIQICHKISFENDENEDKICFEKINSEDIKVGTFLLISRNEVCPCDLLIFDMKDSSCFVDTMKIDGKSGLEEKKPLQTTQIENNSTIKGNFQYYRKILTGKIEYLFKSPHESTEIFLGNIKLRSDPKGEEITVKSVIFSNSKIKNTDWVMGIVLRESKKNLRGTFLRRNNFETQMEKCYIIVFILLLVLSLASNISYMKIDNDLVESLVPKYKNKTTEQFIYFLIFYSCFIPNNIYFIVEMYLLIQKRLWQKGGKVQSEISEKILVNREQSLPNLRDINVAIFDKNAITFHNKFRSKIVLYFPADFEKKSDDLELLTQDETLASEKKSSGNRWIDKLRKKDSHSQPLESIQDVSKILEVSQTESSGKNDNDNSPLLVSSEIKKPDFILKDNGIDQLESQKDIEGSHKSHTSFNEVVSPISNKNSNSVFLKYIAEDKGDGLSFSNVANKMKLNENLRRNSGSDSAKTEDEKDSLIKKPFEKRKESIVKLSSEYGSDKNLTITEEEEKGNSLAELPMNKERVSVVKITKASSDQSITKVTKKNNFFPDKGEVTSPIEHVDYSTTPEGDLVELKEKDDEITPGEGDPSPVLKEASSKKQPKDSRETADETNDNSQRSEEDSKKNKHNGKNSLYEPWEMQVGNFEPFSVKTVVKLRIPNERVQAKDNSEVPAFNGPGIRIPLFLVPTQQNNGDREENDGSGPRKVKLESNKPDAEEEHTRMRSQSEKKKPSLVSKEINERRPDENIALEGENNIPQVKEIRLMNMLRKHYNGGSLSAVSAGSKDKSNVFLSPNQLVSGFATFLNTSPLKAGSKKKNVKNFKNSFSTPKNMSGEAKNGSFSSNVELGELVAAKTNNQQRNSKGILKKFVNKNSGIENKIKVSVEKYKQRLHFFKAISMCHHTRSRMEKLENGEEKILHETNCYEDEMLLKGCKENFVKFVSTYKVSGKIYYKVQVRDGDLIEEPERYQVLGVNEYTLARKRLSIVFKYPDKKITNIASLTKATKKGSFLLVRGNDISMLDILDLDPNTKDKVRDAILTMTYEGKRFFIYGSKRFTLKDTESYIKQHQMTKKSLDSDLELMEKFYDYLERGCRFLGIVGFQNSIQTKVERTIKDLKQGQVKLCMLSSDDESKTIVTAFQSRLLSQDIQIFQLKSLDIEKLKSIIHEILLSFKRDLYGEDEIASPTRRSVKSSIRDMRPSQLRNLTDTRALSSMKVSKNFKNYAILISSKSLSVIYKDEFLMSHFSFVSYFCKYLIAYDMTQSSKESLLRIIRGYPDNNNNLAIISSSFPDTTLMKGTDISLMIDASASPKEADIISSADDAPPTLNNVLPDIIVNNYSSVNDLIFKKSRYIHPNIISIIVFIFYFDGVVGWCLFFLNVFSEFNSEYIISSFLIMAASNIYLLLPIIISLQMKERFQDNLLEEIPFFMYPKKSSLLKAFFVGAIVDSAKDACIVFFFIFFIKQLQEGNLLGYSETSGQIVTALFALAISNSIGRLNIKLQKFTLQLLIYVMCIVLFIIFIVLADVVDEKENPFLLGGYKAAILSIFYDPTSMLSIIFVISSTSFVVYITNHHVSWINFEKKEMQKAVDYLLRESLLNDDNILHSVNETTDTEKLYLNIRNEITSAVQKYFHFQKKKMDQLIQELMNPGKKSINKIEYDSLSLNFEDQYLEEKYRLERRKTDVQMHSLFSLILTILHLSNILISLFDYQRLSNLPYLSKAENNLYLIYFCLILFWVILSRSPFFETNFLLLNYPILAILLLENILFSLLGSDESWVIEINLMDTIIFGISLPYLIFPYYKGLLGTFTLWIPVLVSIMKHENSLVAGLNSCNDSLARGFFLTHQIFISIVIFLVNMFKYFLYFQLEKRKKDQYVAKYELDQETKKNNDVLAILMPKFVKDLLKKGEVSLSEDQGEVTILFCDVCNFETLVAEEDTNIVYLLDHIFRAFDILCLQHEVQKIETVGKTYMACAGMKACEGNISLQTKENLNHTKNIVDLAVEMINKINDIQSAEENENIKIKIGIHYGPVMAGVIGHHKPQFSLIGDTVNTTSRVCSNGENGMITLSENAYNQLPKGFYHFIKKTIEAKGKGTMNVFEISFNSPKTKQSININNINELSDKNEGSYTKTPSLNKSPVMMRHSRGNVLETSSKLLAPARKQKRFGTTIVKRKSIQINSELVTAEINPIPEQKSSNEELSNLNDSKQQSNEKNDALKLKLISQKSLHQSPKHNQSPPVENKLRELKMDTIIGPPDENKSKGEHNMLFQKKDIILKSNNLTFKFFDRTATHKTSRKEELPSTPKLNKLANLVESNKEVIEPIEHIVKINTEKDKEFNSQKSLRSKKKKTKKIKKKENEPDFNQSDNLNEILLNPKGFFLEFRKSQSLIVREFKEDNKASFLNENPRYFTIISLAFLFKTFLIIIFLREFMEFSNIVILLRVSMFCFFIIFNIVQNFLFKIGIFKFISVTLLLSMSLLISFEPIIANRPLLLLFDDIEILFTMLCFAFLNYLSFIEYSKIWLFMIFFTIFPRLIMFHENFAIHIMFIIFVSVILLVYVHTKYKESVESFNNKRKLIIKKAEQESVVMYLLPAHILEDYLNNPEGRLDLIEEVENVTILFADIAGFTKYSATVNASQVVSMLRELFTSFDQICLKYQVYKLYTIGDCYVALGCTDSRKRDPAQEARNILLMAFSMIETIDQVRRRISFKDLNMRIGIHTGDIIGGIIGTDIVRYDIYGQDVLIANKMESNGETGFVVVSQETKDIIESNFPGEFIFQEHKQVKISKLEDITIETYKVFEN